jgi:hypothetical protein
MDEHVTRALEEGDVIDATPPGTGTPGSPAASRSGSTLFMGTYIRLSAPLSAIEVIFCVSLKVP